MSRRFFLDTNALLNAVFVERSWSRRLIKATSKAQIQLVTGERLLEETRKILREKVSVAKFRGDLMHYVLYFVESRNFEYAQADTSIEVPQIWNHDKSHHDQHVVDEAVMSGSQVISSDSKLIIECKKNNIPAMSLLEALRHTEGLSIEHVWHGCFPKKNAGFVFGSLVTPGWNQPNDDRKFTFFHAPPSLWIYYDNNRGSWCAEVEGVGLMEVPVSLGTFQRVKVSLSWQANEHLILRASGTDKTSSLKLGSRTSEFICPVTKARVGSRFDGLHWWLGGIDTCIMDDRPISRKAWSRAKQLDAGIYPNPFDSNRLQDIITNDLRTNKIVVRPIFL